MSSASFADLVFDKLFSISSKMKENSFKQSSSLCLMGDNPNLLIHATDLLDDLLGSGLFPQDFNLHNSVQKPKVEFPLFKNLGNSHLGTNLLNFSPHIFNVVQDSMRYLNNQREMMVSAQNTLNIVNMLCERFAKSIAMQKTFPEPNLECVVPKAYPEPNLESVVQKTYPELNFESVVQKTYPELHLQSVVEDRPHTDKPIEKSKIKMSVTVKNKCSKNNSNMANDKFYIPNSYTLNLELANRKTKEIEKRSKKRRRRQKKSKSGGACAELTTKDAVDSSSLPKSSLCYSNNSKSDPSSFVVTVKQQVHMAPSLKSSFVISVGSASDDDSDWDSSCESDILTETSDFELTGLLVGNLSTPKSCFIPQLSFDVACSFAAYSQDEVEEMTAYEAVLLEVNKKWNESTKGITVQRKLPSKVSFVSDDKLAIVCPVDIYDRKGEWEVYATERLRFKRRIDQLEKIISPCLAPKHRLKMYKKLVQPVF